VRRVFSGAVLSIGDSFRTKGATPGWYRDYVIGAVTITSISGMRWVTGHPELQIAGYYAQQKPVIPCLNCGTLRTDDHPWWDPSSDLPFCSGDCERDFRSNSSRRHVRGQAAKEKAQYWWRLGAIYCPPTPPDER
jgi:hypothetical protein